MSDMHNFTTRKNRAIDELKEMNKRATKTDESCGDKRVNSPCNSDNSGRFNITFLTSNDDLLILGLIIILYEDCQDILLFLALIYILL